MILFVQCYIVFHFLMLFCSFQLTGHVVDATDQFTVHGPRTFDRRSDCYNGPMYDAPITDCSQTTDYS